MITYLTTGKHNSGDIVLNFMSTVLDSTIIISTKVDPSKADDTVLSGYFLVHGFGRYEDYKSDDELF